MGEPAGLPAVGRPPAARRGRHGCVHAFACHAFKRLQRTDFHIFIFPSLSLSPPCFTRPVGRRRAVHRAQRRLRGRPRRGRLVPVLRCAYLCSSRTTAPAPPLPHHRSPTNPTDHHHPPKTAQAPAAGSSRGTTTECAPTRTTRFEIRSSRITHNTTRSCGCLARSACPCAYCAQARRGHSAPLRASFFCSALHFAARTHKLALLSLFAGGSLGLLAVM